MSAANKAALITAPVGGQNTYAFAGDDFATTDYVIVPISWQTNILTVRAIGAATWYLTFGGADLTGVAATAKSTIAAHEVSPNQGSVAIVPGEAAQSIDLEPLAEKHKRRMALYCPSGASTDLLEVTRSSGPVS